MFQNPADYWGLSPEQANRLPLGLRKSNNLFNVKYVPGAERNQSKWPGLIGPSEARDQGDPQMKFGSVDDGGVAGANLLRRKYDSGMTTPNQIIAGRNGWTPEPNPSPTRRFGEPVNSAAGAVAGKAGVGPDDDLKLSSPDGMRRMLPALAEQEHGPAVAKSLFSDDMFDRIAGKATGAQFASGELPKLGASTPDGNAYPRSMRMFLDAENGGLAPWEQDIASRRWDDQPSGAGGQPQPQAQVAGSAQSMPPSRSQEPRQMEDEEPGLLQNIANRTIYNPGFQQGLGLFLAASQGKDLNEGLNSGVQRGGSLFAQHQKMIEMRRQQATQAAVQRMMRDPEQFKNLPQEIRSVMQATGDPTPGIAYMTKHLDAETEREKNRLGNLNLQEQIDSRRQQGAQHDRMYPLQEAEAKARIAASQQKDPQREFISALYGRMLPGMRQGQQQPGSPAISQQPRPIPQSFEGDGTPQQAQPAFTPTEGGAISTGDPNIIRTQAAGQPTTPPNNDMVTIPGLPPMSRANADMMAFGLSKDQGKYVSEQLSKQDLGKHTTDKMNEKQFNAIEQVSRLNTVAEAFDPKFLTLGETVKQAKLSWQEYLTGSIPPESEVDRSKYVTFQQSTLSNLNKYIQEMTGAAMSDGEAARLKAAMPNMNMDPTQFKTALNNVRSQSLLAIARYNYLRDTQFKGKAWDVKEVERHTSIDGMRKIIHDRRDQLLKDIRSEYPKANEADVQNAVKARIGRQFGIDA